MRRATPSTTFGALPPPAGTAPPPRLHRHHTAPHCSPHHATITALYAPATLPPPRAPVYARPHARTAPRARTHHTIAMLRAYPHLHHLPPYTLHHLPFATFFYGAIPTCRTAGTQAWPQNTHVPMFTTRADQALDPATTSLSLTAFPHPFPTLVGSSCPATSFLNPHSLVSPAATRARGRRMARCRGRFLL